MMVVPMGYAKLSLQGGRAEERIDLRMSLAPWYPLPDSFPEQRHQFLENQDKYGKGEDTNHAGSICQHLLERNRGQNLRC
jgi:hypothetical protein